LVANAEVAYSSRAMVFFVENENNAAELNAIDKTVDDVSEVLIVTSTIQIHFQIN